MNKKRLCTILGFIAALNINTTNCVNVDKEAPVETKTIIELVKNVKNMVNEYLEENSKKEIFSFGYLKADSNIYDYTDSYTKVNTISKYQKVVVLSETKEYYYVETEENILGYINKNSIGLIPDTFVEVDISDQTVNFYMNNELVLTTPCVTGNKGLHTRTGYFSISYKKYDTYLKGPGYKSHVYYWMPFDQAIGLHDADGWRSEYGGDIYLTNGSHGCINMPHTAAETIYNNVSAGTKVLVHK
jgi:lipoprotein-anchoring transpeptidase ErfK/SrfK